MRRRTLADVTGQRAPSPSVFAAPWPYLLSGALILAAGAFSMFGGSTETSQARAASEEARQEVSQLERVVQEIHEMLRNAAVQSLAQEVREGSAREQALLTELRQLVPEVTDVHTYESNVFMTDLSVMGDNGFIMLDMMAAARENELSPVQLIEDGGLSYVAAASTVGRAVQENGFMVVYLDPTVLLDLFTVSNPAAGYIGLEHAAGANAPMRLREVGPGIPAGYNAERLPVSGSLLQVVYPATRSSGLIGPREQIVLLGLGTLLLGLGFARRRSIHKARPTQETMPEHFATLRDGDLPPDTLPPTLRDAQLEATRTKHQEPKYLDPKISERFTNPGRTTDTMPTTSSSLPPLNRPPGDPAGPSLGPHTLSPDTLSDPPLVGRISQPAPDDDSDEMPPSLRPQPRDENEKPVTKPEESLAGLGGSDADAEEVPPSLRPQTPAPAPTAPEPPPAPTPASADTGGAPSGGVELKSHIFRAYDIRGVVGESLDRGIAYQIGQAVGSLAQDSLATPVAVGRDGRHSGPDLVDGLIAGLSDSGCPVVNVGAVPTGVLYYAANELAKGSGVMVTGSHNPPDYNGFKIMIGGRTLAGDDIFGLFERIRTGNLHHGEGEVSEKDAITGYRERIAKDIQLARPLKVVADCGNGIGGVCAAETLQDIGADVIPLYDEVDGDFPNHHPDPSEPRNLEDLIESVKLTQADLGIAFDGDADRLGVVTAEGEIVYSDRIMMLYAREVLNRNPGATIIYDVKCTGHLDTVIREAGGVPEMYKTGHSLMKNRLKETGAPLAGEMSGHFFFEDRWYGFDCGIYSACRLLEILAARPDSPTDVLNALPNSVSTPELKVELGEGENHDFIESFKQRAKFPGARINIIDGVRADYADSWGLVRASNTTPILVLRFDADTKEALKNIQEIFRAQLLAVRPDLDLPF